MSPHVAQAPAIFAGMVTYYCYSFEEALRRAKIAGKKPGCYFGGITLKSGRQGFAIYQEGKVVERYVGMRLSCQDFFFTCCIVNNTKVTRNIRTN